MIDNVSCPSLNGGRAAGGDAARQGGRGEAGVVAGVARSRLASHWPRKAGRKKIGKEGVFVWWVVVVACHNKGGKGGGTRQEVSPLSLPLSPWPGKESARGIGGGEEKQCAQQQQYFLPHTTSSPTGRPPRR